MSSEEFRKGLNSGKPLFSIQVDDLLVQEIFQKLSDQIAEQRREIEELKKELSSRPTVEEFTKLSNIVNEIQTDYYASRSNLSQTVDSFYSSLDERTRIINELVQRKTNEMLFAVNAAIRSEMENLGYEPKITQDTLQSVHDLKLNYSKAMQKIDDLKDSIVRIAASFEGSARVGGLNSKNAAECIRIAAEKDRKNLADMKAQMDKFKSDFDSFRETFEMTLPMKDFGAPKWNTGLTYNRNKKPELPTKPQTSSVYEYLSYMGRAFPYVEAVLREFHSYIQQIDATVQQKTDREEFEEEVGKIETRIDALVVDVEDYRNKKDKLVFQNEFEGLAGDLYAVVSGASNAAATNTKCIVCGKKVQRTTGSMQPNVSNRAVSQCSLTPRGVTATNADILRLDGLQQEPSLSIKRVKTARVPKRPAVTPK